MRKIKKTNSLVQRWFQKQLQYAYSNSMKDSIIEKPSNHFYFHKGVDIKVFFASNGGKILRINMFDNNRDTPQEMSSEKLYIINEDEDFGQSLNNIITMEALR